MGVIVKAVVDVLNKEECKTTRSLWEEVFFEDSVQFTDYYFENRAEKNVGYVIGQAPYDAMMFRTPYPIQIGKTQKEISYIVGVATRKECRHRGYMRTLLRYSFREMYEEKMPFTFLMPANPAIYEPFDFQYVYERDVWELKEPEKVIEMLEALTAQGKSFEKNNSFEKIHGLYSVRSLRRSSPKFPILGFLAEFANRYLKEYYSIYVYRDESYYEMQLKESEAQNGDIYVFFKDGEIKAFFLYAKEDEEVFIQEVMEEKEGTLEFLQKAEKKKPIIMARIIHLEEMMKLVCSRENKNMIIEIEDDLIPENAGVYEWKITPDGSQVAKIHGNVSSEKKEFVNLKAAQMESKPEISMHIREFATQVLKGVFINEIV